MAKGSVAERANPRGAISAVRGMPTFQALHSSNYRLLWIGMVGNSMSLWMEMVARSWLVWQLTESGLALGLVNLLRASPFLIFGLISGVAADRMDKRRLLLVTQSITMSIHFVTAALILSGLIQLWQVYLTAFVAGISMSFEQPNRQSLIPQLVEPTDLMNGVALSTMAMNTSRILGPALAGFLIGVIGVGGVYVFQGLTYVGVIAMTAMLRMPGRLEDEQRQSAVADLKEGFTYVVKNPVILGLMIVAQVPMVFGMPYTTILPVFADKVLNLGASGLGLLLSATGVGALAGAATIATLGSLKRRGLILLGSLFIFGAFLIAFGFSTSLYLSLALMSVVGITFSSYMAINTATLLEFSPPALHGRVMAIYLLNRGLTPIGAVIAGAVTDGLGAPVAMAFMGTVCVLLASGMGVAMPQVRQIS